MYTVNYKSQTLILSGLLCFIETTLLSVGEPTGRTTCGNYI